MGRELLFPTVAVDGRDLTDAERDAPNFAGMVEFPRANEVREHTRRLARFSGWIACREESRAVVTVRVGDEARVECPADTLRNNVGYVMAAQYGMPHAYGFSFFVDLPPLDDPIGVELVMTDGRQVARSCDYVIMPDCALLMVDTCAPNPPVLEELAVRHLRGRGLEFGALHAPVAVDPSCEMQYADRMSRADSVALFDSLGGLVERMVEVDHLVDLDTDDLSSLSAHDFDFFVATGVIEHLVNPLRFLDNLHRVMRPGALFLLGVPDRDFSWDCDRELTTVQHLLEEFERGEQDLSEEHLIDFVTNVSPTPLPEDEPARSELLEYHRKCSIHVHVWDEVSFAAFLHFANERLGLTFEIVDRATSREGLGNMFFVLRKAG